MKNIIENTTILVPGHNVKWFAVLAIESFLACSPFKREQVVFFDDNSTDGTKEELENRGIKVITWDKHNHNRLIHSTQKENLCARVGHILHTAYEQIETKYILTIDSDMVFFKDPTPFFIPYLKDNLIAAVRRKAGTGQNTCYDIYQNLSYVNAKALKEKKCLGDNISDFERYKNYWIDDNGMDYKDTGFSFYMRVTEAEIPAYYIDQSTNLYKHIYEGTEYFIHFEWISSAMRKDENCVDDEVVESAISKGIFRADVDRVCESIGGISIDDLIESYEKNFFKSQICD